jgi:hypothetical protein
MFDTSHSSVFLSHIQFLNAASWFTPPPCFCDSRMHKSVFDCFFLLYISGFNAILTMECEWRDSSDFPRILHVTYFLACYRGNKTTIQQRSAPINKSHSTSQYSPTIWYSVFIKSCSNRCQVSAMFPFSREDVGILGRPSLSVGGGEVRDQWIHPPLNMCTLTWQSSRWESGRMVTDRITPHPNQGWCIVAGTNLKVNLEWI